MALFDRKTSSDEDVVSGTDAGSRALSVAAVENDFVEGVYDKLAKVYDLTFGPTLHPGRLQAIQRMDIQPGERVLEVGVGTGINLSLYPKNCSVTGIDFSGSMLEKARERAQRKGIRNMRLLQMDAGDLKFSDGSFDIVYAPYLISVVPDPIKVAQDMCFGTDVGPGIGLRPLDPRLAPRVEDWGGRSGEQIVLRDHVARRARIKPNLARAGGAAFDGPAFGAPLLEAAVEDRDAFGAEMAEHEPTARRGPERRVVVDDDPVIAADA